MVERIHVPLRPYFSLSSTTRASDKPFFSVTWKVLRTSLVVFVYAFCMVEEARSRWEWSRRKKCRYLFAGVNRKEVGRFGNGVGGKDLNLRQMKWKPRLGSPSCERESTGTRVLTRKSGGCQRKEGSSAQAGLKSSTCRRRRRRRFGTG